MKTHLKMMIGPCAGLLHLAVIGCDGGAKSSRSGVTSGDFEHQPPVSVVHAKVTPISNSPYFTLLWKQSGVHRADDASSSYASMHDSRTPEYILALRDSDLQFVSVKSGASEGWVKLPNEICRIHRNFDGDQNFGGFSYSILGGPADGTVVIMAACMRISPNGSGSGVATAIYGSGMDGKVKWCAKVGLTHNLVCAKTGRGELIVLVQDKREECDLVGISPDGRELFRVDPGLYDKILVFNGPSGELRLVIDGAQVACYELENKTP